MVRELKDCLFFGNSIEVVLKYQQEEPAKQIGIIVLVHVFYNIDMACWLHTLTILHSERPVQKA